MSNIATKRVQAGIEFLNGVKSGWQDVIDIQKIDMSDSRYCTLGQLYDGYESGLSDLGLTDSLARSYGFEDDYGNEPVTYGELTSAWKAALTASPLKKYRGKYSGKDIRVIKTERLDGKNYVIYTGLASDAVPSIVELSSFMASFEVKERNWEVGQVLRTADGTIFMVAGDGSAWKLSGLYHSGSSYSRYDEIEKKHGNLSVMKTASGHNLVGGMDMYTCKTK